MDRDTQVFETSDVAMGNLILFRRKRQAARASRELKEVRLRDKKKEPEVSIALAHTRSRGFKWCVTESQVPVRRK